MLNVSFMQIEKQSSRIMTEEDGTKVEVFPVPVNEKTLFELFKEVYENYWDQIRFGPLIQGAAWEVGAPNAPTKVSLLDGYLTVDFGPWHFHVCIGDNEGSKKYPTPAHLKEHRKTSRA